MIERFPKHQRDFDLFLQNIVDGRNFFFVRFSDGEMEVLQNNSFELSGKGVSWSKGDNSFVYPEYDRKKFDPGVQKHIRDELMASLTFHQPNYWVGLPSANSKNARYINLIEELTEQKVESRSTATYSDLLINDNYMRFIRDMIPALSSKRSVTYVGNYRADIKLLNKNWNQIKIGDGIFDDWETAKNYVISEIEKLDERTIVLCSASSLTNVVGMEIAKKSSKMTFIDIGTALHPFIGLEQPVREYHNQLTPWNLENLRPKLGYYLLGRQKFRWPKGWGSDSHEANQ